MKKIKFLALSLVTVLACGTLSACDEDDGPKDPAENIENSENDDDYDDDDDDNWIDCPECSDGTCLRCDGDGLWLGNYEVCDKCDGDGDCWLCDGYGGWPND